MKNFTYITIALFFSLLNAQAPVYDACSQALELCPNLWTSVSNKNCTTEPGANAADGDLAYPGCARIHNSAWFSFTTNLSGGNAVIDIRNISCINTVNYDDKLEFWIISAATPCDASTYNMESSCLLTKVDTSMTLLNLTANTTYYIVMDGLQATATNAANCDAEIKVSGSGIASQGYNLFLNPKELEVCQGSRFEASLTHNACEGNAFYSWYLGENFYQNSLDSIFSSSTLDSGFHQLSVIFECDQGNCVYYDTSNVVTFRVVGIEVNAGNDTTIVKGDLAHINASTNGTFTWTPEDYLSDPNGLNITAMPPSTQIYELTATVENCTRSDQIKIKVTTPIDIPDVITPNDDGINDAWIISRISNFPFNKVEVFNRWGQRVFKTSGYSNSSPWDGTFQGKLVPGGVYYYIIQIGEGAANIYKGALNVVY